MVHEEPGDVTVVPKVPKSPRMSQPKKDKKTMGPFRVSPRNPRFGKLSMEEKGKYITNELDEEEEDLQALIYQIEVQDDVEEDVPPMPSIAKLPAYVSL